MPGVVLRARVRDAGAGDVWAGRVVGTGAECTVRRVRLPPDAVVREAAMRTARAMVGFDHPHLVPLIDVVTTADGVAVVAEPVSGAISLTRLLEGRERLDPGEVVTIGLPLAQALAAAHAVGIVHGQLDPADILLEPNGRPVLAGVGVAGLAGGSATPPVDVGDLASLLLATMPHASGPDAAAVAVAVAPALVDELAHRPTAEELAAALARSCSPAPVRLASDAVTPLPLPPPPGPDDAPVEPVVRRVRPMPPPRTAPRPVRVSRPSRVTDPAVAPAGTRALTAAPDRPRSMGARVGTGRAFPARASAPHGGFTVSSGHQRGLLVIAGVVVVLAALGLLFAARSTPGKNGRPDTAAGSSSPEQAWRDVLSSLDSARSRAFEQADEAGLVAVDAVGSTAYAQDVSLMRQMVALGGRASGLRQEILDLAVRESGSEKSVLRITYRRPPYSYVDADGKVLAQQPGHDRWQSDMTLVRTEQGWRIATVTGVD